MSHRFRCKKSGKGRVRAAKTGGGLLRKHFLREHHRALYSSWLLTGKLDEHLRQIEKDCEERFELITMQMAERENVTEGLKADDQMEWLRRMNSIWNRAEEIVLHELIYV